MQNYNTGTEDVMSCGYKYSECTVRNYTAPEDLEGMSK
jgi:hypothetical protein